MNTAVFIAGYVRTPFTLARKGALAGVRPDDLGAHAIRSLLERTGVPAEDIEDVVWGCAFPEGEQGLNIGRMVGLLAGLPVSDPLLDRLRTELLNLAASGSSLEKAGVQTHFVRQGLADFAARLAPRDAGPDGERQEAGTPEDDPEARFLRAAQSLREMADGTSDYHRLLGARKAGHDGDLRR